LIILETKRFTKSSFKDEEELEKVVVSHYEVIFGNHSLYLPQKSIATSSGIGSMPDALVIDLAEGVWHIVEIELAEHGTWQHIVPQVSREIVAAVNPDTKRVLIASTLDEVVKSEELKKKFIDMDIQEIKIQGILEEIMVRPPIISIPIDEMPADLKEWAESLGRQVRILKVSKYLDKEGGEVAYEIPEYLPLSSSPRPEEEEIRDKGKVITQDRFLAECDKLGVILFQKLKELASEKRHHDELIPRTQSFSYYVTRKAMRFCLLNVWPNGISILKDNIKPDNGFAPDAIATFWEVVSKMGELPDRFEAMKQPGFAISDITEDDINQFVSVFKRLIDSLQ